MEPHELMGRTLLALQIELSSQKSLLLYRSFSRRWIRFPKKSQKGSGDKLTTLPVQGTSEISTVKERSYHIANEHFKIIR